MQRMGLCGHNLIMQYSKVFNFPTEVIILRKESVL